MMDLLVFNKVFFFNVISVGTYCSRKNDLIFNLEGDLWYKIKYSWYFGEIKSKVSSNSI